ncbi:MAG TPA: lysophospholipid acyltransferase family protein [Candidatus Binatia bacterium]|nr:lysophospholipid acyltransferase family protein [Candidatus Binatia bacterium]
MIATGAGWLPGAGASLPGDRFDHPGSADARSRAGRSRAAAAWCAMRSVSRVARRIAATRRAAAPPAGTADGIRARAFAFSRLAGEISAAHGLRTAIAGPVPRAPVILAANHVSYVDPLVLAALVPCVPLAKREVARWPLIGSAGRAHGVLFVERGDARSGAASLLRARRALASGVSVLNFPEGTTTRGDGVLPFRRGIFGLARALSIPVVPVAIQLEDPALSWTGDARFVPHYLRMAARGGALVHVRFGYPMTPERYGSAEDLAREARAIVGHMLAVAA